MIYIPKSMPGWIGGSADGLGFKLFHGKAGYLGADVGTYGCTMDLFIILTLEEETDIFMAKISV